MGKYLIIPLLLWAQLINTGPRRKIFGGAVSCSGSPTGLVQSAVGVTSGFPNTPFASNNTAGNVIVVWYSMVVVGSTPTIGDTRGNTYTGYAIQNTGNDDTGFFIATGIAAGANTVSFNTYGAAAVIIISEWSGVTGIETSNPSTNTTTAGPITTTATGDVVLMGTHIGNGLSATITGTTGGWALINSGAGSPGSQPYSALFGCNSGAAGSYSNTFTISAGGTPFPQTGMVALKR